MAYAEATDVQARLGRPLTDEDAALVNARLGDVEILIKSKIPDLDQKVASGDLDVDVVKLVEVEAVLRLVRNPNGFMQESDGNYSYMMAQEAASGKLEILPEEWSLLGYRYGGGMFQLVPNVVMPR
ncbi:Phage protein Gp19/Gp15/Gp42 [Nocardia farcinica]|uniref:Gp19/Gp15/Gp42 family protein n=1 Tax=Nocardia farcinica TaxID=37329 RepID=UPI000E062835|nr:Gp19/Gp15/Gp42 family protein [Nocardia farcinica]SUE29603.1 Phage protein Gp19/Gp15/Gp42 [Nocardia farcinica]